MAKEGRLSWKTQDMVVDLQWLKVRRILWIANAK